MVIAVLPKLGLSGSVMVIISLPPLSGILLSNCDGKMELKTIECKNPSSLLAFIIPVQGAVLKRGHSSSHPNTGPWVHGNA